MFLQRFIKTGLAFCLVVALVRPIYGAFGWAAQGKSFISVEESNGSQSVVHTGWSAWTLDYDNEMSVAPGDIFTIAVEIGPGDLPTRGRVNLCAKLCNCSGGVVSWSFASSEFRVPSATNETATVTFVVPDGVASVSPCLVGEGETCFTTHLAYMGKSGTFVRNLDVRDAVFRSGQLSVKVRGRDAGMEVQDNRTGRVWRTYEGSSDFAPLSILQKGKKVDVTMVDLLTLATNRVVVFSDRPNSLVVEVRDGGKMSRKIRYPAPFMTESGDRLIVPLREGIGYPVDENVSVPKSFGLSMPFFGVAEDKTGAGWMALVETPDDMSVVPSKLDGYLTAGVEWLPQMERFGYSRRIRFSFQNRGGHVAMAKRYRKSSRLRGRLVTFEEKRKLNPKIDALLGAANIWYMYGSNAVDSVQIVKEMQLAGIKKILWSNGGNVKVLAGMTNVLVSTYDVYQDVGHPEQERKFGRKMVNAEAWPRDIVWEGPTSNDWAYAWGMKAPDGTWTHCAMMCDAVAPTYARKKIADDIAKRGPFNCRFIDTTTAAPLRECWNPAHRMTRSDSRRHRCALIKLLGGEFGLVAGSEDGNDTVLPWCDYFEGMMSLNPYRVPDSGRDLLKIWQNPPENVVQYQVGEKYRLPLWELVYHDCCVSYWYWGDYNNKIPSLWRKRDLFNALYATPPMFLFDGNTWSEQRERFVESYKCGGMLSEATGYSEMLNHRILTKDRSVQRTDFANGISVVANFGEQPFKLADGTIVNALSHVVVRRFK